MSDSINIFISHAGKDEPYMQEFKELISSKYDSIRDSSMYESGDKHNNATNVEYVKSLIQGQIDWAGTVVVLIGDTTAKREWADWVVGCVSEAEGSKLSGFLIYAMRVDEKLTYDAYWEDARYELKRPQMNGSLKVMYGDNIYHHDSAAEEFIQEDSRHSYPGGVRNEDNYRRDTQADAVLVSRTYWYWGGDAVPIPSNLSCLRGLPRDYRRFQERDCEGLIEALESWLYSFGEGGYLGRPAMFGGEFRRYSGK